MLNANNNQSVDISSHPSLESSLDAWEAQGRALLAKTKFDLEEIATRAEARRQEAIRDDERRPYLEGRKAWLMQRLGMVEGEETTEPVSAPLVEEVKQSNGVHCAAPFLNGEHQNLTTLKEPVLSERDAEILKDYELVRLRLGIDLFGTDGTVVRAETLVRELLNRVSTVRQSVLAVLVCMPWMSAKEIAAVIRLVRDCPDGSVGAELAESRRAGLVMAKIDEKSKYITGTRKPLLHAATDAGVTAVGAVDAIWYSAARRQA